MSYDGMEYVGKLAYDMARLFENRLWQLPSSSGILFISVLAVPVVGGKSLEFNIVIGIDREFDVKTGEAIVRSVFEKEISCDEIIITTNVIRGIRGPINN